MIGTHLPLKKIFSNSSLINIEIWKLHSFSFQKTHVFFSSGLVTHLHKFKATAIYHPSNCYPPQKSQELIIPDLASARLPYYLHTNIVICLLLPVQHTHTHIHTCRIYNSFDAPLSWSFRSFKWWAEVRVTRAKKNKLPAGLAGFFVTSSRPRQWWLWDKMGRISGKNCTLLSML